MSKRVSRIKKEIDSWLSYKQEKEHSINSLHYNFLLGFIEGINYSSKLSEVNYETLVEYVKGFKNN